MRRDPEAIRAEVSAIAEELKAKHCQLLDLSEKLQRETREIPMAMLEQREPPPLVFHIAQLLQAAEQALASSVKYLEQIVGLDEAELADRWRALRRKVLSALMEATMAQLSTARDRVGLLALCGPDGLSDEEIPGAFAALSAIKKIAQEFAALEGGPSHLAREEHEEEGEGS